MCALLPKTGDAEGPSPTSGGANVLAGPALSSLPHFRFRLQSREWEEKRTDRQTEMPILQSAA